jgi:S1-C subfamily serine protease/anti-anti-sigma regulatory factor
MPVSSTLGHGTRSDSGNSIGMELAEQGESSRLRLMLRGSLEGPWTAEVEQVWTTAASVLSGKELVIDITGLTGMDENGLQLLARMRDAGVRLTISPPHNAGNERPRSLAFPKIQLCVLTVLVATCCAVFSALLPGREATPGRGAASESSKRTSTMTIPAVAPAAPLSSPVERSHSIIDRARQSVCLIQGTFVLRDRESGKLLTRSEWTLDGGNEALEVSFSGTGFLVAAEGKILTNRHIAEPWWENRETQQIMSKGYRPELQSLVAYFPGLPTRCVLKTISRSHRTDLALLQTSQIRNLPPPLCLETEETMTLGKEVLLLGYPAGLTPMIARSRRARLERIPGFLNFTEQQVSQALAKRNLIAPLLSGGYVSNVSSDILTLSALTSDGSSGSPVLNEQGRVGAIVFALLPEVAGGTLAVPARFALELTGAPQ